MSLLLAGLVLSPGQLAAAETNDLAKTFEAIARTNRHFSHTVIIKHEALLLRQLYNAHGETEKLRSWAIAQLLLLEQLKTASKQREALIPLLEHDDPKVRTLAVGALFQREDPKDLPLIASLLEDDAPTFPDLIDESISAVGFGSLSEQIRSQDITTVASAMLLRWGVPDNDRGYENILIVEDKQPNFKKSDFTRWAQKFAADPQQIKLRREHNDRRKEPRLALYLADTQKLLADLDTLPARTRAWLLLHLYLLSEHYYVDPALLEKTTLTAFKELGPEETLRFLHYQPESNDPLIKFDAKKHPFDAAFKAQCFEQVAHWADELIAHSFRQMFILRHAHELFRPEDAPALLAGAKPGGHVRAAHWVAAAAEVAHRRSPAESRRIIDEALKKPSIINDTWTDGPALLYGVLWRTEGMKATKELIDWFYAYSDKKSKPLSFLTYVDEAGRADTNKLLAALVADQRFDLTSQDVLIKLACMSGLVDRKLFDPIVTDEGRFLFSEYAPSGDPATLAKWRKKLRAVDFTKPSGKSK